MLELSTELELELSELWVELELELELCASELELELSELCELELELEPETKPELETALLSEPDNVYFNNQHPSLGDRRRELLLGLQQTQKTINPKFFYDANGSELFDQITQLPEYYPSRTEMAILRHYGEHISQYCGEGCVLIEPGSGSSEKVRLLLDEQAEVAVLRRLRCSCATRARSERHRYSTIHLDSASPNPDER